MSEVAVRWGGHPRIVFAGGLLPDDFVYPGAEPADPWLVEMLHYVYRTETDLLLELGEIEDPPPDILVTAGEEPNAHAIREGSRRAIVVQIGLLRAAYRRVSIAAHHPDVLGEGLPYQGGIPDWVEAGPLLPPVEWMTDDDRTDHILELNGILLAHVVLHELAHHERGHLDGGQSASLSEADLRGHGADAMLDLELEADIAALDFALKTLLHLFGKDEEFEEEVATHCIYLILGHLLLVQIFEDGEALSEADSVHPAAIFRAILHSDLVTRYFRSTIPKKPGLYGGAHDSAWSAADAIAKHVGLSAGRWHTTLLTEEEMEIYCAIERRARAAFGADRDT